MDLLYYGDHTVFSVEWLRVCLFALGRFVPLLGTVLPCQARIPSEPARLVVLSERLDAYASKIWFAHMREPFWLADLGKDLGFYANQVKQG